MLRLAPSVKSLEALGARSVDAFLDPARARELPRAAVLRSHGSVEVVRFELPVDGARRDADGARRDPHEFARALLTRFLDADWRERVRARFTAPRSESLAEREWNLLCWLRASGVAAPEPLAVGSTGSGWFARRSFLVTRELSGMRTLADWTSEKLDPSAAAHIARAVGSCLARLFRARVSLPGLSADRVLVSVPRVLRASLEEADACGDAPAGVAFAKLPEVALADCRGGRIVGELDWNARVAMVASLCASLPRPPARFAERVAHVALARERGRSVRDPRARDRMREALRDCVRGAENAVLRT